MDSNESLHIKNRISRWMNFHFSNNVISFGRSFCAFRHRDIKLNHPRSYTASDIRVGLFWKKKGRKRLSTPQAFTRHIACSVPTSLPPIVSTFAVISAFFFPPHPVWKRAYEQPQKCRKTLIGVRQGFSRSVWIANCADADGRRGEKYNFICPLALLACLHDWLDCR